MPKNIDQLLKIITETYTCWKTAKAVMDLVQDDDYVTFDNIEEFYNYVSSLDFNILLVEFCVKSKDIFTSEEKNKLMKDFNLSNEGLDNYMIKYDNLRFLAHVFNIFKYENRISIGQSWIGKFKYGISDPEPNPDTKFQEFISRFKSSLYNFNEDPYDVYKVLGVRIKKHMPEDNIINLVKTKKFDLKFVFMVRSYKETA